jgi:hypothetical protein
VVVANSLGSGLLESGVIAPCLPGLARHLLGEELLMPSVPAYWCGRPDERAFVVANLDRMVIKSAYPGAGILAQPVFGEHLSSIQRAELTQSIERRPEAFIAQERLKLSTTPVWLNGALDPRPLMVRVFVAAHESGYAVMPGGLTRVAGDRGGNVVSMQLGGGSKDTWVISGAKTAPTPPTRGAEPPVKLLRGAHDLPSRVADNLYWFGRYVERSEDIARLLRAAFSRVGRAASYGAADELPIALGLIDHLFQLPRGIEPEEAVTTVARMNFDPAHMHGLRATIERVQRMAAMVRDRLSLDTWRAVTRLQEEVATVKLSERPNMEDLVNLQNRVVLACEALSGLTMENMTRGPAWRFLDIGRRLERGMHVLDLLSHMALSASRRGQRAAQSRHLPGSAAF